MTNTDYVTKPVAIALKEAGYDEPCIAFYDNTRALYIDGLKLKNSDVEKWTYTASTWTAAATWLYEQSSNSVCISLNANNSADITLIVNEGVKTKHYTDYESAFLAAIGMIKREAGHE